jgi:KipI family sensor histidine kinase inhibitor
MNHKAYHLEPLGDQAILIQLAPGEPLHAVQQVQTLQERLTTLAQQQHWELVPGLESLTIFYDARREDYEQIAKQIQALITHCDTTNMVATSRTLTIPVCYDSEFGIDLSAIAQHSSLAIDRVIELHTTTDFTVGMIGFLPGFPYLLGLPVELHLPRRASPRTVVPAGSVAIAIDQCGIYPQTSPGGWHIIGRTPMRLFDVTQSLPSLLQSGDRVRFQQISRSEYDQWSTPR